MNTYVFRIGGQGYGLMVCAKSERAAWAQIDARYPNTWVELTHTLVTHSAAASTRRAGTAALAASAANRAASCQQVARAGGRGPNAH